MLPLKLARYYIENYLMEQVSRVPNWKENLQVCEAIIFKHKNRYHLYSHHHQSTQRHYLTQFY